MAALEEDVARLWEELTSAVELDVEPVAGAGRDGMLAIGARLLAAAVAVHGTGKVGPHPPCACGAATSFAGYRTKQVPTVVGWIPVRRASYACPACGHGPGPLEATFGLARDSLSPGVRRLSGHFGALLPLAEAAAPLAVSARVQVSASTARTVTEAVGARREAVLASAIAAAWAAGLPAGADPAPDRLYVARDGVHVLGTEGTGHEVNGGVGQPVRRTVTGAEHRAPASYAAGLEPAAACGQRVALEAHRRGAETALQLAARGEGAAWIWSQAEEHLPTAVQIVDWFHASERVWALGRALCGEGTPATAAWVEPQLGRLRQGEAARLAREWQALACAGTVAAVRDEPVTSCTNQAPRMADAQYRAAGWDIGRGMGEGACKHLIGARAKGPGMRWSKAGAQAVATVRVLLFNQQGATYDLAA